MANHIHHDKIIAWAKGEEIEFKDIDDGQWYLDSSPNWLEDVEYRIYTPPVVSVREVLIFSQVVYDCGHCYGEEIKLDGSGRNANVICTFTNNILTEIKLK